MVFARHIYPGVAFRILHAQRDTLLLRVDFLDHDINDIALADEVLGFVHSLCIAHLRYVYQPFDAGFDLNKTPVVHTPGDLSMYLVTGLQSLVDGLPRICIDLFYGERQLFFTSGFVCLDIDHLYGYHIAGIQDFIGACQARPAYLGYVHHTLNPRRDFDERTIGHDVADPAFVDRTDGEGFIERFFSLLLFLLEQNPPGDNDVFGVLFKFRDYKEQCLANIVLGMFHIEGVYLAYGAEGSALHHFYAEPSFYRFGHPAFDRDGILVSVMEHSQTAYAGYGTRELYFSTMQRHDIELEGVTDGIGQLAVFIEKLGGIHDTVYLVAGIQEETLSAY